MVNTHTHPNRHPIRLSILNPFNLIDGNLGFDDADDAGNRVCLRVFLQSLLLINPLIIHH